MNICQIFVELGNRKLQTKLLHDLGRRKLKLGREVTVLKLVG
jgi:hypothetical protein